MRRLIAAGAVLIASFAIAIVPAGAVTNGQPDGNNHPYVGYVDNGVFACSGTLLSPTVFLTAAHCFSDSVSALGTNSITDAPIVRASFDPNLINTAPANRVWWYGSYYFDPDFGLAGGGLQGFDTHDVAIVIFTAAGCSFPPERTGIKSCGPIPGAVTSNTYGVLPQENLVDTLEQKTPVDLVGYGVQNFVNGGGPCGGPCKKTQGESVTRFYAQTALITSNHKNADEFIRLQSNAGGVCFGDSGGPDLLARGNGNVVLAVNSFGPNSICTANSYSYRVDTAQALDWITSEIATQGGSIP
jgi:hypothetical protein